MRFAVGGVDAIVELKPLMFDALVDASASLDGQLPGGFRESAGDVVPPYEITIDYASATAPFVHVGERKAVAFVESGPRFGMQIGFLLYWMLEHFRQSEMNMCTMKAAAFVSEGRATLVLGDKGAGKTSLIREAERRGMDPLCDDILVLDTGMQIRHVSRLSRLRIANSAHGYEIKKTRILEELSIFPCPIRSVIRISLFEGAGGGQRSDVVDPLVEMLRLGEALTCYYYGVASPWISDEHRIMTNYSVPGSASASDTRSAIAKALVDAPMSYVRAANASKALDLMGY